MILLLLFILFYFIYRNQKPLVKFLLLIQICSLVAYMLINKKAELDSFYSFLNLFVTGIYLLIIILAWSSYGNVCTLIVKDEKIIKRFTNILLIISFYAFVVLLITAILVNVLVDDINTFKYGGESVEFYYNMLPFNVKFLILAHYLYGLGYFMIPLHFYYLSKQKYWLSFFCFLFSLNIILYGLTYFSRATIVNYIFIYLSIFLILYKAMPSIVLVYLKRVIFFVFVLVLGYFSFVTLSRFNDTSVYSNMIPSDSFIQNPALYSVCDYLSQWYPLSIDVLNDYSGITFNGQTSLKSLLSLLNHLGIGDFSLEKYTILRNEMWKENSGNFVGFVAYIIYDYGYIISFLLLILYLFIVTKLKSKYNTIRLFHLFYIVLLVQIPLMAIFYSIIDQLIIPFIFLLSLSLFSRLKLNINR